MPLTMAVIDGWSALLCTTQMLNSPSAAAALGACQAFAARASATRAPVRIGSLYLIVFSLQGRPLIARRRCRFGLSSGYRDGPRPWPADSFLPMRSGMAAPQRSAGRTPDNEMRVEHDVLHALTVTAAEPPGKEVD